jgi:hypothetical protein
MARRASSGVNTQALLIGALILIVVLGGGYWFINRKPPGFDAPVLDAISFRTNGRSLAGNKNQVTGVLIAREIRASSQIVTLEVEEDGNPVHVPIIIPEGFKAGNLNQKDTYTFLIEFNTDGVPVALDVTQF